MAQRMPARLLARIALVVDKIMWVAASAATRG